MLTSVIGRKLGMTQIFDEKQNVVPVTVVDVNHCYVTQLKTNETDGYTSVQVGLLRKRFRIAKFSSDWLRSKKDHFLFLRELTLDSTANVDLTAGEKMTLDKAILEKGSVVSVSGLNKGKGFQGVVKRHGFAGGPSGHGSNFHRAPGGIGHLRTQGEVIKGRGLPGQDGNKQVTVKGLKLVGVDKEAGYLFIKGALPGRKDSLVVIRKQG